MTDVLIRWGNLDIDTHKGRALQEDKGRNKGDASTNQGTPKIASKPSEVRHEAWDRFSLPALRRNQSC